MVLLAIPPAAVWPEHDGVGRLVVHDGQVQARGGARELQVRAAAVERLKLHFVLQNEVVGHGTTNRLFYVTNVCGRISLICFIIYLIGYTTPLRRLCSDRSAYVLVSIPNRNPIQTPEL